MNQKLKMSSNRKVTEMKKQKSKNNPKEKKFLTENLSELSHFFSLKFVFL